MFPLIMVLVLAGTPKVDPKLAGRWTLAGETFCTLNADGTGAFDEEPVRWGVDGGKLVLTSEDETERIPFKLEGDTLTLQAGPLPVTLTRVGKPGKAADKKTAQAPVRQRMDDEEEQARTVTPAPRPEQAPAGRTAGNDALSRLLLSSAWCTFSFNKTTGASSQSRVRFFANGTWTSGRQAETYTSGAYGSVAGQYNSGSDGQWAVKGGRLYLSNPPEVPSLMLVEPFVVTRNSNGYPIIQSMGQEYSQCE